MRRRGAAGQRRCRALSRKTLRQRVTEHFGDEVALGHSERVEDGVDVAVFDSLRVRADRQRGGGDLPRGRCHYTRIVPELRQPDGVVPVGPVFAGLVPGRGRQRRHRQLDVPGSEFVLHSCQRRAGAVRRRRLRRPDHLYSLRAVHARDADAVAVDVAVAVYIAKQDCQ